jgi:hypothetical protein
MPHPIIGIDNNGLQAYLIPGESQVGVMELSRMAPVDRESPLREFMYSIRLARAVYVYRRQQEPVLLTRML